MNNDMPLNDYTPMNNDTINSDPSDVRSTHKLA